MSKPFPPAFIRCYAEGRPGKWEAFALDLDLAVQGTSVREVREKLMEQIALHLESIADLPEAERDRLAYRRVPLWVELRLAWKLLRARWPMEHRNQREEFDVPASELVPA